MDGRLCFRPFILGRFFPPPEKTCIEDFGMLWSMKSSSCRVVRPGPVFPKIIEIPKYIEILLPPRRARIECLARSQLNTRNKEMQLMVPGMTMANPQNAVGIPIQSGKSNALEVLDNVFFLLGRYDVVRMPRKRTGGKFPLRVERIYNRQHHLRIATHNFGRFFLTPRVISPDQVMDGCIPGTGTMREDFHVQGSSPSLSVGTASEFFSVRSSDTRAPRMAIASARSL